MLILLYMLSILPLLSFWDWLSVTDDPRRKMTPEDSPTFWRIWVFKKRRRVLGAFVHNRVRGELHQWLAGLQGPSVYEEEVRAVNVFHVT